MKHDSNKALKNLICVLLIGSVVWIASGCAGAPARVDDARIDCRPKACRHTCKIFKKAEAGSARHQTMLGETYATGHPPCVPQDPKAALFWYRKAAAQGDARAMFRIAEALQYGRGTAVDELGAMRWYARAAEAGYDDAWERKVRLYKYGPPGAKASYDALAARNAAALARGRGRDVDELGVIAISGSWKDGGPRLGKPRSAAAGAAGKLAVITAVGGIWALTGSGPVGIAFYTVLLASAGIKDSIENGKSGKAIHKELNSTFEHMDLDSLVRDELRNLLDEAGAQAASRRVMVAGEDTPGVSGADTRIELTFMDAELDNIARAWQFELTGRPGLVLTIETRVRAIRADDHRTLFEETIEYKGHRLLNGLEEPFRAEVRKATHYIAARILLRLAQIENVSEPGTT